MKWTAVLFVVQATGLKSAHTEVEEPKSLSLPIPPRPHINSRRKPSVLRSLAADQEKQVNDGGIIQRHREACHPARYSGDKDKNQRLKPWPLSGAVCTGVK